MRLNEKPFEYVKAGRQTIEMRLFDEKRQALNLGDYILFSKRDDPAEKARVEVVGLLRYPTFRDLIEDILPTWYGSPPDVDKNVEVEMMRRYYSEENEQKFGVVGIKMRLT